MLPNTKRNLTGLGIWFLLLCMALTVVALPGCSGSHTDKPAVAVSGVKKVTPKVAVGQDGMTAEQRNVLERLKRDNTPGAIKHLYVFSAFSGQCVLYSTVREKVTSSGKRLSPTSVVAAYVGRDAGIWPHGLAVNINGETHRTSEVLQDDGTYGNSIEYLYWVDQRGVYHQHYVQGGSIVHISDEPMPVKNIIVNVEAVAAPK